MNNDDKTLVSATIRLGNVGTGVLLPLDVTVVIHNNAAISEYYFIRFFIRPVK